MQIENKSKTLISVVFLITLVREVSSATETLKFGFISPTDGPYGYRTSAAATTMAIEKAKKDGLWKDVNVTIEWRNGACSGKQALGVTVTLQIEEEVDAYIGLPCSIAAINAGKIISFWNLPHLSYSSPDPELANKNMYTTLVRMISPFNRLGSAMVDIFKNYEWTQAVMLSWEGEEGPGSFCDYASRAVEEEFRASRLVINSWLKADASSTDEDIEDWLQNFKSRGRIVLICVEEYLLRKIMLAAHAKGMTNGEYVFIYPNLLPSNNWEQLWREEGATSEENDAAFHAYKPLLQMALGSVSSPEADRFRNELPKKMMEAPWYWNQTYEEGRLGSVFSLYLHDAVYMYALATDQLFKEGGYKRNGSRIYEISKTKTFQGVSGTVELDSNGDRIGNYWLWEIPRSKNGYDKWAEVRMTDKEAGKQYIQLPVRYWGSATGYNPPLDYPLCGFYGQKCPSKSNEYVLWVAIVSVILVIMIGALGALYYRRRKFERDLELMLWKINYNDIIFLKGARTLSDHGGPGHRAPSNADRIYTTNHAKMSMSASRLSGGGTSLAGGDQAPTTENLDIGSYRDAVVAVKRLAKTGMMLTREDQMELKTMKELSHENVNGFVGMCVDPPNICILTKYCPKGSLRDVLENDAIKLDITFKLSLLFDLVAGIEYIHRSKLKSHGRLKSTNCCIDGRWVLKVTDFGLNGIRDVPTEDNEKFTSLLWTAPEILRDPIHARNGTQAGDIYSIAIILQEILYRCGPYEATGGMPMVPKDLIGRVRNGESTPFRPPMPDDNEQKVDRRLLEMMRDSWQEDPHARPDIVGVKTKLSEINKGKRYNIMDNMLKMMEKYANNLEELVAEKTKQLTDEKKKTDLLLYRMLPGSVADALKSGKTISAEVYKGATVYFSDICGFTALSSESSPIEVVNFLNDLWTVFDDIIAQYNVYKVETIGDAYMVVGGIPSVCADHAIQISNMALDIISSVLTFKIRHKPEKQLRVRIGLHSGPAAAGIVGLTMPRYCLFGDTVNTASRMESTGLPMRIHLSETTHGQLIKAGIYHMTKRGEVMAKGKGNMTTYWLEGRDGYTKPLPSLTDTD